MFRMSPFPVSRVSRVLKDRTICEDHKLQKIEGIVDRWQEDLKERKERRMLSSLSAIRHQVNRLSWNKSNRNNRFRPKRVFQNKKWTSGRLNSAVKIEVDGDEPKVNSAVINSESVPPSPATNSSFRKTRSTSTKNL